ncbi:hypothetical protein MIV053L [Invertebrate iridescent virus 3]|uniref:Uncharacterized protein 053L n=1 Tax=Invertebrate iridescent virus 3 TaxID=345201 RepID=053L_IIV3|nr:hypothetical protein MIV053L [Invertebrate iridescent virus 3]Q197A7.1 RecName: Full=Uncharacterized protein 053L [Invertebrate iridescent virus 3]ABF82083.1 hypothetical protein MIV053L [Invertebrate iridescent virus 3]
MEQYLQAFEFVEEMVVLPKYLSWELYHHLAVLLREKYPKTYKNKGYIFNIKVKSILDNRITPTGQIVLVVMFQSDLYVPQVGHVFTERIRVNSVDDRYQWITIEPLTVFLRSNIPYKPNTLVTVQICSIKMDNTLCFGTILD